MIQTKFFDSDKIGKVEDEMNRFFRSKHDNLKIIKIRYYKNLVEKAWINEDQNVKSWFSYSVMLVYEV